MARKRFLPNQRFGRLVVSHESTIRRHGILWVCRCDCGNLALINSGDLGSGNVKSCGCLRKENIRRIGKANKKHGERAGHKRNTLYSIWLSIKTRCYNPKSKDYKYWGGKGITVCVEWKNNYLAFKNWALVHGYKEGLTIDRINSHAGYSPENCQFLTRSENTRKRNRERGGRSDVIS